MVERQVYDPARLANTVAWLENEQQQNREQFQALRQQMDRVQNVVDEQASHNQLVEEALNSIRQQLSRIATVEEASGQTRNQLGRVETLLADVERSGAQFQRTAETKIEELQTITAKMEHSEHERSGALEALGRRMQSVDEMDRRRQDSQTLIEQRSLDLTKLAESADTRSRATGEQLKRANDEADRTATHLDALVNQDEALSNRLQVSVEKLKSMDDKVETLTLMMEEVRSLPERFDLHRSEVQRMLNELNSLAQDFGHLNERLEDLGRQVRDSGGRNRESFDKIMALRQEIWEFASEIQEHLAQLLRTGERQKRREITELEQQIKELRGQKSQMEDARLHE